MTKTVTVNQPISYLIKMNTDKTHNSIYIEIQNDMSDKVTTIECDFSSDYLSLVYSIDKLTFNDVTNQRELKGFINDFIGTYVEDEINYEKKETDLGNYPEEVIEIIEDYIRNNAGLYINDIITYYFEQSK